MLTTFDVLSKYKSRLNKSDSEDYDNLWVYQVEETYNKGVQEVVRKMKRGKGTEGDEITRNAVDDLQVLLKDVMLAVGTYPLYSETIPFPDDYLYYKRLTPIVTKGICERTRIKSHLKEEANVDDLLVNFDTQPSFDFEETFNTVIGNRSRVYHNGDFYVDVVLLTYYKQPKFITFNKKSPTTLEFKDDVNEMMIDEGIKIMAGDIENSIAVQLAQSRGQLTI